MFWKVLVLIIFQIYWKSCVLDLMYLLSRAWKKSIHFIFTKRFCDTLVYLTFFWQELISHIFTLIYKMKTWLHKILTTKRKEFYNKEFLYVFLKLFETIFSYHFILYLSLVCYNISSDIYTLVINCSCVWCSNYEGNIFNSALISAYLLGDLELEQVFQINLVNSDNSMYISQYKDIVFIILFKINKYFK